VTYTPPLRETLADSVYTQLREAVISGRLPSGSEVKQAELAKQLGVSRVPVREALRRLQAERLLEANPFHRYVVSSLSEDQIVELLEVREELEVFALRRTVMLDGDALRRRVAAGEVLSAQMHEGMDQSPWLEIDRRFHYAIHGGDSAPVAGVIDDLRQRLNRYMHSAARGRTRGAAVLKEHEVILEALSRRDAEATEAAIRSHIRNTKKTVIALLRDQAPPPATGI
jgi:DNA-binding GntR family transcriptional regulator